jgi:hypothetical protein
MDIREKTGASVHEFWPAGEGEYLGEGSWRASCGYFNDARMLAKALSEDAAHRHPGILYVAVCHRQGESAVFYSHLGKK